MDRSKANKPITNGAHSTNGTKTSNGVQTPSELPPNAWSTPGPAAFDFRSINPAPLLTPRFSKPRLTPFPPGDVTTTPTASMLASIQITTLLDDVFGEDPVTNNLEAYIADLTGHEAGLLVMSGTMGNQLSIRTHLQGPPHSVLADAGSHIIGWEAGNLATLSQALSLPVSPSNGHHLTLSDVKRHAVTSTDIHACPTRLICLENTLAGTIMPLKDCQEISAWAHAHEPRIRMHLDGARLWEAVAAGAGSLKDYCSAFDSVSLCFSKGLGAPIGSMIVGSRNFVERARHIRKGMGGGLRQAGVISAPARVAVDETFLGGKLTASHKRAMEVARMWESRGGRLARECETNMVWFDLAHAGIEQKELLEVGVEEGVKLIGGRLVVHYQIGDEGVGRLGRVMDRVLLGKGKVGTENGAKEEANAVMAPEME